MTKRITTTGKANAPPEHYTALGRPLNPATPDSRPFRSGDLVLGAARIRAEERGRPAGDAFATRLEAQARTMIAPETVEVGAGGELVPSEARGFDAPTLRNTVSDPDYVTADASRDRLELAHQAGALELALDTADTIEAQNSLEMMLAHQLAAAHCSTMKLSAQLNRCVERMDVLHEETRERANVQGTRLAGAIARMMTSYQQGVLTLQRMRSGGRQVVTVQHVHVGEGGQAVVAGKVAAGGRSRRTRGGECENE